MVSAVTCMKFVALEAPRRLSYADTSKADGMRTWLPSGARRISTTTLKPWRAVETNQVMLIFSNVFRQLFSGV